MIGIDLFSGAGGMSLGATLAGIKVLYAIEANRHACTTYAHNQSSTELLHKRIEDVTKADFKSLRNRRRDLVVFGGPPCQGFSTSNQRTRTETNPQNWLFLQYIRVVKILQPEWIVFENVIGITQTANGHFLDAIRSALADAGYPTIQSILNSVDFGVPQRRSRLFLVANRSGGHFSQPTPLTKIVTVGEAIGDLPVLGNGASIDTLPYGPTSPSPYARRLRGTLALSSNHLVTNNQPFVVQRYPHVPQGGNWEYIPSRLMKNYANRSRCHEWIYRRLSIGEPSVVIENYRKNMLIHPTQDRGLSVREAARLQSFPDAFEFQGSIGLQQQQVVSATRTTGSTKLVWRGFAGWAALRAEVVSTDRGAKPRARSFV
ncbi:MAG: DNA cytosine methyltransferase, partial [Acidobacteriaceae bacterium]